jgi:thioredoxin-related protein
MRFLTSLIVLLALVSFKPQEDTSVQIQWLTWDEAIALNAQQPKKILIDVYTDWCGWCKKMDKETFSDPKIIAMVNTHFYAVKLDAEQKEQVLYKEHTFSFQPEHGRRGAHELAISLLDGRMGYPSLVFLDEKEQRITISPGYKDVSAMQLELSFISGNHYVDQTFEAFKNQQ